MRSTPGDRAGIVCRPIRIGMMNTPIARSSVVISRYRYDSASSHTNVETARDGFANGTCRTSIVCMPMTVGQRQDEERGGDAARLRVPPCKVDGVGDAGGGVQDQRKNVQRFGA
jgi:hypothetical protein